MEYSIYDEQAEIQGITSNIHEEISADVRAPTRRDHEVLPRSTTRQRAGDLDRVSDAALALYLIKGELAGTVYSEGQHWCYTGKCWEAVSTSELGMLIQSLDGRKYIQGKSADDGVQYGKLGISAGRRDSILKLLRDREQKDFFAQRPEGINCANGFVTFDASGNPAIEPHSAAHRQRHVLPGSWRKDATGAALCQALLVNFKEDEDAQQKIDLIGEATAVGVLGRGGRTSSQALVFTGEGGSGKSTVFNMLTCAFPESVRASVPPSKFADKYDRTLLIGKSVNIVAELGSAQMISSEDFKKMITGDEFTAKSLWKDPFNFRAKTQHFFAVNPSQMPTIDGGLGREITRRLIFVTFNRIIPKEEQDETVERLGVTQPDDFIAWIVDGASRYIRQGGFTVPASAVETMTEWTREADPTIGWFTDRVVTGLEVVKEEQRAFATYKRLFADFTVWHHAEKLRPPKLGIDGFGKRLASMVKGLKGVEKANSKQRGGRGYWGLRLKPLTQAMADALNDLEPNIQKALGACIGERIRSP